MKLPKQTQAILRVQIPMEMDRDIGLGDVIGECKTRAVFPQTSVKSTLIRFIDFRTKGAITQSTADVETI